MTTIKHTLQRQVFLPSEERLVQVVHVTKAGRKKKESFLCAAGKLVPRDKLWHCIYTVFHTLLVYLIFYSCSNTLITWVNFIIQGVSVKNRRPLGCPEKSLSNVLTICCFIFSNNRKANPGYDLRGKKE